MNLIKLTSITFLMIFSVTQVNASCLNCRAFCISKADGGLIKKLEGSLHLSVDEIMKLQNERHMSKNLYSLVSMGHKCKRLLYAEFSQKETVDIARTKVASLGMGRT